MTMKKFTGSSVVLFIFFGFFILSLFNTIPLAQASDENESEYVPQMIACDFGNPASRAEVAFVDAESDSSSESNSVVESM